MLEHNYIVGLVDGEGSFTAYVFNPAKKSKRKRRARVEPKFYLKLVESDKKILYELKKFFGCGNVYFQKDTRKNHQNCYRYEVTARDDLMRIIIPFFKKHQPKFPSRAKDFKLFCRIMKLVVLGRHLGVKGLENILEIKSKMH
ncbi:MAG: LAGLIDADG family homing endonuclease [Patescibacteria group bacterium]